MVAEEDSEWAQEEGRSAGIERGLLGTRGQAGLREACREVLAAHVKPQTARSEVF